MSSENQQPCEEDVPLSIKALPKKVFADIPDNETHAHDNRHEQRRTTLKFPIPWELSRYHVELGNALFRIVCPNEHQPQRKHHQNALQDVLALHVVPDDHEEKTGQREAPEDELRSRPSYRCLFLICKHLFAPLTRIVK